MFRSILESEFVESLGWVLLHSLWQIALLAMLYLGFKSLIRSAQGRYLAGVATLFVATLAPLVTLSLIVNRSEFKATDSKVAEVIDAPIVSPKRKNDATFDNLPKAESADSNTPREFADNKSVAPTNPLTTDNVQSPQPPTSNERLADSSVVAKQSSNPSLLDSIGAWRVWAVDWMRPWIPLAVFLWIGGVLVLSVRPILGTRIAHKLARRGKSNIPERLRKTVNRICKEIGLSKSISVFTSKLVNVPLVVGYFRPMILLPASALTNLSAIELESVLRHELAHIKRHDAIVNFFQTLVETLLFYHPCLWWISNQIRLERENCCDDLAIARPEDAIHLAQALLRLEELRVAPNILAASGGDLKSRIARLVAIGKNNKPVAPRARMLAALATATLAVLVVVSTIVSAKELTKTHPSVSTEINSPTAPRKPTGIIFSTDHDLKMREFKTLEDLKALPKSTLRIRYIGDRYGFGREYLEQIVRQFPELAELDLREVRSLRDADVEPLSKLTNLRSLCIRFAERLTAASIATLAPLTKLETLDLSYTRNWGDDRALSNFPTLAKLKRLILARHSGGGCTQKSLTSLQKLPSLESVLLTQQHPILKQSIGGQRFRLYAIPDYPHVDYYSQNFVHSSLTNFAGVVLHAKMLRNWTKSSFEFPTIETTLQIFDPKKFADSEFADKRIQVAKSQFELVVNGKVYKHNIESTRRKTLLKEPRKFQLDLRESDWLTETDHQLSGNRFHRYLDLKPGKHAIKIRYRGFGNMDLETPTMIIYIARSQGNIMPHRFEPREFGTTGHSRQVAARPLRKHWSVDEIPVLNVRLHNRSVYNIPEQLPNKKSLTASTAPNGFAIEVDGKRYDYRKSVPDWTRSIPPGESLDCQLYLNYHWMSGDQRLKLKPGKYKLKVLSLHISGRKPASSNEFEITIGTSDETELKRQRNQNEQAYQQNKKELHKSRAGKWMAIADGKIHGPFDSLKSADEKLKKSLPKAKHRFIFRPAVDDKDVSFALSLFQANDPAWRQVGMAFARKHRLVDDVGGNKMYAGRFVGLETRKAVELRRLQLQMQLLKDKERFGDKHPKIVSLKREIDFYTEFLDSKKEPAKSKSVCNTQRPHAIQTGFV